MLDVARGLHFLHSTGVVHRQVFLRRDCRACHNSVSGCRYFGAEAHRCRTCICKAVALCTPVCPSDALSASASASRQPHNHARRVRERLSLEQAWSSTCARRAGT